MDNHKNQSDKSSSDQSNSDKPNYEAILFDLDGTLIDTAPDFITVVNQLRREENLDDLDATLIRKTVSNGARALITLAFDLEEGEPNFEPLRQRLLDLYLNHLSVDSVLFAGGPQLLNQIEAAGIPWGIVTNKPSLYATPLVKDLMLNCQTLICPDHVTHRKPHPEPLHKAATELQVPSQRCLYVGDHKRDIESGRNAGMKTVAALYGYIEDGDDPKAWRADHYINNMMELIDIIF